MDHSKIDVEKKHLIDPYNRPFLKNFPEKKRMMANEIKRFCSEYLGGFEGKGMLFNKLSERYFFSDLLEREITNLRKGKEHVELNPYFSEHDFKNSSLVQDSREVLRLKLKDLNESDFEELDKGLKELITKVYSPNKNEKRNLDFFLERYGFDGEYKFHSEIGREYEFSKQFIAQCTDSVLDKVQEEREKILDFRTPYIDKIIESEFSISEKLAKSYVERNLNKDDWGSREISTARTAVSKIGLDSWNFLFDYLQGEDVEGKLKNNKVWQDWHETDKPAEEIAKDLGLTENTFHQYKDKLFKLNLFERRNPIESA